MIYYVLDTGVILPNYFNPPHKSKDTKRADKLKLQDKRIRECYAYIYAQWIKEEAKLIIPNFILAETINQFAYYHFRELGKTKEQAKRDFLKLKEKFINQVIYTPELSKDIETQEQKCFFNYELNRHHILNLEHIIPIEHTTEPIQKTKYMFWGKHALSAFDLLLISVAMELRKLMGKDRVFILTREHRLWSVCQDESLPKCYKLSIIEKPEINLPRLNVKEELIVP